MLFYFVRHGQTDHNAQHILAGSGLDLELNEAGRGQARALGERVRAVIPEPVERVVASNMKRARATGEYVARALGVDLQIHPDLREWHLGEWEGKNFADFGHLLLGDGEPSEGESRRTFYGRIEKVWRDLHRDDLAYVIVSHGDVWLALQDILRIPRFRVDNCSLVRVWTDGRAWDARII